jgi:hypothetical protein
MSLVLAVANGNTRIVMVLLNERIDTQLLAHVEFQRLVVIPSLPA